MVPLVTTVHPRPPNIHRAVARVRNLMVPNRVQGQEPLRLVFFRVDLLFRHPGLSLALLCQRAEDIHEHHHFPQMDRIHLRPIPGRCPKLCLQRPSRRRLCSLHRRESCHLVHHLEESAHCHAYWIRQTILCRWNLHFCLMALRPNRRRYLIFLERRRMSSSGSLYKDTRFSSKRRLALQTKLTP